MCLGIGSMDPFDPAGQMTPISSKALVVGAEGVIGSALYDCLVPNYSAVYGTSRRVQNRKDFVQIDLSNSFDGLSKIAGICDIAFICAATTKAVDCDNNRAESYAVNVTNTLKIIKVLQDLGVFIVWLSSSAVFSGKRPFCGLDEPYMPLTEYGRQKAEAEQEILELGGVAIVRLTKVLSKNTPLISGWVNDLRDGKEIYPFSDAYFSPISLNYATNAIAKVGRNGGSGIFNISGSDDISYSDFARILAVKLCGVDHLVKPVTKAMAKSTMLATGRYSSLDMKEITSMADIKPQLCADLLEDIL